MELNFGNNLISTIGVLLLFGIYFLYAGVIQKKNKVQEAFASIDVQLKKRYDLIPNILAIAQKFMEHERSLIEDITKLRTQAINLGNNYSNIDKKIDLDAQIRDKMKQMMIAVENYPQLKSDQTMVIAMQTYNEVEEHIAAARRFFNAAALDLKNAVEIFPSSVIAKMLNIKSTEFFTIEEKERQSVNAAEFFNKN
ncbi:MAG: LemA family protein [Clostridium sp.]|nr:LemA family protein [Clostridium sp.]